MAVNTVTGRNIGFVNVIDEVLFDDVPALSEANVTIIKEYNGNTIKTWKKDRPLNGVNSFKPGSRLLIQLKAALDLSAFVSTTLDLNAIVLLGDTDGKAFGDSDGTVIKF